jgi:hypothetical protein
MEKIVWTDRVTNEAVLRRVEKIINILYTTQEGRLTGLLIPTVGTGL